MKIALCSDEPYDVHKLIVAEIEKRGHEVVRFGSFRDGQEALWARVAGEAAAAIAQHQCDEGVFCCWSATGIGMAANKVPGIRAAVCTDAESAKAARIWNHANVLALSNRLLSPHIAKEILHAWFETSYDSKGQAGVDALNTLDNEYRKPTKG